ncbi:MAG: hypothetical protein AAGA29_00850 [Planctomycetota bacterium]
MKRHDPLSEWLRAMHYALRTEQAYLCVLFALSAPTQVQSQLGHHAALRTWRALRLRRAEV